MVTNFDLWFDEVIQHFQWRIPPEVEVEIKDESKNHLLLVERTYINTKEG